MEGLSETLSVALRAHPIFFLLSGGEETDGDGKGCDWSSNNIISEITFPGLTTRLIYFVHCLLCTFRTNKTPSKI